MGKLDTEIFRDLTPEDFRVLIAVEMGMKNHEMVPANLCVLIAHLKKGGCTKIIEALCQRRLLAYEVKERLVSGYRLTTSGYDFLALKALISRGSISRFGNKIGVGKESDVYVVQNEEGEGLCLKLHRLGRTSFRQLKNKRDYHKNRSSCNWLYLSRLSASREYQYMVVLHREGFLVPTPIDFNRNAVVMQLIDGVPLCQVKEVKEPGKLYHTCITTITTLASFGLIHADFNEFNLILAYEGDEEEDDVNKEDDGGDDDNDVEVEDKGGVDNDEEKKDGDEDSDDGDDGYKMYMIDFPQMVSTSHANAKYYFDRDVECVRAFFLKKFHYDAIDIPDFHDIVKTKDLDLELKASGYIRTKKNTKNADDDDDDDDEEEEDDDDEKEGDDDGVDDNGLTKDRKDHLSSNIVGNDGKKNDDDDEEDDEEYEDDDDDDDDDDGIKYLADLDLDAKDKLKSKKKSQTKKPTTTKKQARKQYTETEVKRMQAGNRLKLQNLEIRKRTQKEARKALKHKINSNNPHLAKLQPVWDY